MSSITTYKRIHETMQFVEDSRLPDGHLLLSVYRRDWSDSPYLATVGKIGMVGEWEGRGATEDDAIQAAMKEARKDENDHE